VLETDHTLVLGWSRKVFSLVSELSIANESRSKAAIVIPRISNAENVLIERGADHLVGDLPARSLARATTETLLQRL